MPPLFRTLSAALGPLRLLSVVLASALLTAAAWAAPAPDDAKAQTIVHMLDYVGVDYPSFVRDGKVLDEAEFQEQREFATQAVVLLGQLPAVTEQAGLVEKARRLVERIDVKAPGAEVTALAGDLRSGVMKAWQLSVAPRAAPDLAEGQRLFATQCATCHGAQGRGDGPLARGMDPAPSDFHDAARMQQRSLYGLYNTVTLGVGGTPMRGFAELSEAERWALAFYVGGLRDSAEARAEGQARWRKGEGRGVFESLRALVTATPQKLAAQHAGLDAVRAHLTQEPGQVLAAGRPPLAFARDTLDDAVAAYGRGEREVARRLAIAAYLEGFELVEAALDNVDAPLRTETEVQMMALRAAIGEGRPPEAVAEQAKRVVALLDRAEARLSGGNLSAAAAFFSALLILLREGLEALLVLAAIIAFVKKTGRRDALPYIHAGWLAAVALGAVTWAVARYVVGISGANRELTEGVTALLAAAMLLYVGYWLHSRSNAQAWNAFIREHVGSALGKGTLWAMAGVSFLAVYRELFEVVLFYETLWAQVGADGQHAVLGGIACAAVLLALLGGAILRYSVRLPIGPFFAATSILLALLAVVFVGSGVAALQEAGVLDATAWGSLSLPLLGIHPTVQGLGLQAATLALVVLILWITGRSRRVAR